MVGEEKTLAQMKTQKAGVARMTTTLGSVTSCPSPQVTPPPACPVPSCLLSMPLAPLLLALVMSSEAHMAVLFCQSAPVSLALVALFLIANSMS